MHKVKYSFTAFIVVVFFIFSLIVGGGVGVTYAAISPQYTNVLDDLLLDKNFDEAQYLAIDKKYEISVIQIAESVNNELFIYTYQPCANARDIKASSINIARTKDNSDDLQFLNYSLEFLNSNGVFYKYKVLGFELSTQTVRYYNISNILYPFDSDYDEPAAGANVVDEVKNRVGQIWTVETVGDSLTYKMKLTEVVLVENKYVGYCRYSDGAHLFNTLTDIVAHFVAFSVDWNIDYLYEADITYVTKSKSLVTHGNGYGEIAFGEPVKVPLLKLTYTQEGGVAGSGFLGDKKTWSRILRTSEFLASENDSKYKITSGEAANFKDTQWVLRFLETDVKVSSNLFKTVEHSTLVDEVMVLRLKFEKDGTIYNLGVVDNKQSEGVLQPPINTPINPLERLKDGTLWLFVLLLIILLVALFAPLLPHLFNLLFAIILLPFRLIGKLFKRKKE